MDTDGNQSETVSESFLCSPGFQVDVSWKFSEHLASLHFPLRIEKAHIAVLIAQPEFPEAHVYT